MKKQNRTAGLRTLSFLVMVMAMICTHRASANVVYANNTVRATPADQFEQTGYEFGDEIVLSPAAEHAYHQLHF